MSALDLGTHEYLQSPLHVLAPRPRSMLLHVTTWSENVQDVITWTEDASSLLVVTGPPTPQTCAVETHTSNVWGRDPNFKCMRRHQQLAALRSTLERLQLSSTFPIELTQPDSCGWRFVLRYLLVKLLSAASGARLTWWELSISVSGLLLHPANAHHAADGTKTSACQTSTQVSKIRRSSSPIPHYHQRCEHSAPVARHQDSCSVES